MRILGGIVAAVTLALVCVACGSSSGSSTVAPKTWDKTWPSLERARNGVFDFADGYKNCIATNPTVVLPVFKRCFFPLDKRFDHTMAGVIARTAATKQVAHGSCADALGEYNDAAVEIRHTVALIAKHFDEDDVHAADQLGPVFLADVYRFVKANNGLDPCVYWKT